MSYKFPRVHNRPSFINNSKLIHGRKYKYNKVVYTKTSEKIQIWCNRCNKYFWQRLDSHLSGHGCKKCGKKFTTKKFIQKAKEKYGDKYGYDKVIYKNSWEKVKIYCRKCEKYFFQT